MLLSSFPSVPKWSYLHIWRESSSKPMRPLLASCGLKPSSYTAKQSRKPPTMPCCMETELLPTWSASGKEAENIRGFGITGSAGAWLLSTTLSLSTCEAPGLPTREAGLGLLDQAVKWVTSGTEQGDAQQHVLEKLQPQILHRQAQLIVAHHFAYWHAE